MIIKAIKSALTPWPMDQFWPTEVDKWSLAKPLSCDSRIVRRACLRYWMQLSTLIEHMFEFD